MIEEFREVKGYEGIYEVSNLGNVKSLERFANHKSGTDYLIKERILKAIFIKSTGYLCVSLHKEGVMKSRLIHQLVAESFLNHIPDGHNLVVSFKNKNSLDIKLSNLEIVTTRESTSRKHIKSASKYVGVTKSNRCRKEWRSTMKIKGKIKLLGYFDTEIEAGKAYQLAVAQNN